MFFICILYKCSLFYGKSKHFVGFKSYLYIYVLYIAYNYMKGLMMEKDSLYEGKSFKVKQGSKAILENMESKRYSNKPGSGSILVAEDNRQNQKVLQMLIVQKYPYLELFFVGNGKELLEELDQQSYDLILLDIGMPVMDGFQAIKKIREMGSITPVVALTACAVADDRQKCLDAGCNDYLAKPIDINRLYEIVDKYIVC